MWPKRFRKHPHVPAPDRQRALACIPIPNPGCRTRETEEGTLITYPVHFRPLLARFLPGRTAEKEPIFEKKLQLDHLGSMVWSLIDGKKTVADISRTFQERYQLNSREAEISVAAFVHQLGKKGLIALREPDLD